RALEGRTEFYTSPLRPGEPDGGTLMAHLRNKNGTTASRPLTGPAPAAPAPTGLVTTCLATVQPRPVHWLVPGHLPLGKLVLQARPEGRLVVVDPAGAYIGKSGIDDHKDSDLRALLGPLAELAARHAVTILLVKHLNKGVTAKAVHKVGGSVGYVNAVRAAF